MTPQWRRQTKLVLFYLICTAHLIVVFWRAESLWSLWILPFLLAMYYILYWMLKLARDDSNPATRMKSPSAFSFPFERQGQIIFGLAILAGLAAVSFLMIR